MGKKTKQNVLDSATLIVVRNIVQGDFLTRMSSNGEPLVFSEWEPLNLDKNHKSIIVQRTLHTLSSILRETKRNTAIVPKYVAGHEQMSLFSRNGSGEATASPIRYRKVRITDVYKEEVEIDGSNSYAATSEEPFPDTVFPHLL